MRCRLHQNVFKRLGTAIALRSLQHESTQGSYLLLIANDAPLDTEWLDHAPSGDWHGHRECHIGGDFLLAYKRHDEGKVKQIVFVRTGTHAELFD